MHDIKVLEAKWRRYRRKKLLPYLTVSGVFVALSVATIVWGLQEKKQIPRNLATKVANDRPYVQASQKDTDMSTATQMKPPLLSAPIAKLQTHSDTMKQNVTPMSQALSQTPVEPVREIPVLDVETEQTNEQSPSLQVKPKVSEPKRKKRLNLHVVSSVGSKVLDEVERRFARTKDPYDALFLAKRYFRLGRYQKAALWAQKSNEVDPKIEESWLIFAKAKIKQGRLSEAVAVLEKYVGMTKSKRARRLLERLRR